MSKTSDILNRAGDMIGLASAGLGLISKLTANTVDDKAAEVLAGIREVLHTVEAGTTGKLTVEACQLALTELSDRIAATDRAADERLRTKFDPER